MSAPGSSQKRSTSKTRKPDGKEKRAGSPAPTRTTTTTPVATTSKAAATTTKKAAASPTRKAATPGNQPQAAEEEALKLKSTPHDLFLVASHTDGHRAIRKVLLSSLKNHETKWQLDLIARDLKFLKDDREAKLTAAKSFKMFGNDAAAQEREQAASELEAKIKELSTRDAQHKNTKEAIAYLEFHDIGAKAPGKTSIKAKSFKGLPKELVAAIQGYLAEDLVAEVEKTKQLRKTWENESR